jgi:hypothetical protein
MDMIVTQSAAAVKKKWCSEVLDVVLNHAVFNLTRKAKWS